MAHPILDLVLDKVENTWGAVSGPQPPPVNLAVGFRRIGWASQECGAAAPAFDGGGVVGFDVVSVHEKPSVPPWGRPLLSLHLYFGMDAGFF